MNFISSQSFCKKINEKIGLRHSLFCNAHSASTKRAQTNGSVLSAMAEQQIEE
jgi:hypothetical protein